jgi:sulfur-oxidizing protein SoxZ
VSFHTVATESGTIDFEWTGDNGFHETGSAKITVE